METNDPKLTAYALGELDATDRAAVEAEMEQSETLRKAVDQIRETARLLETALAAEEAPHLSDEQRNQIQRKARTMTTTDTPRKSTIFSFARRHWFATGAIAASIIFFVGVSLPTLAPSRLAGEFTNVNNPISAIFEMKGERPIEPSSMPVSPVKNVGADGIERLIGGSSGPSLAKHQQLALRERHVETANPFSGTQHVRIAQNQQVGTNAHALSMDARVPSTKTHSLTAPEGLNARETALWLKASQANVNIELIDISQAEFDVEEIRPRDAAKLRALGYVPPGDDMADVVFGSEFNTESYDSITENPFRLVTQDPLSTFSIDVDTASYANVRRFLNSGSLPPPGAVRIEELINYFNYSYPPPASGDPFSVNVEVAECPWDPDHRLARIGLKGYEVSADERPPANLVFLIDVSGSMQSANKLPLLKEAMKMLVNQLTPDDDVAIAVYAGASGLVLSPTPCGSSGAILSALDALHAGGSTNGAAGIQLAYETAESNMIPGGVNRVILATDGDFNVGVTSRDQLIRMVEEKAKSGVFLSVLGFGMGNLKDSTLEQLADKGNGHYAYIDTIQEAQKVLVDQIGGTLMTIAKDVKIQIEFNPAVVSAYRLIGYENRMLAAQDFNDDKKDAGEIGAGHTVTALYEIVPTGVDVDVPGVDPLKYQATPTTALAFDSGETMTVKLRYKEPDSDTSKLIEVPITDTGAMLVDSSDDFAFAASVAGFGMLLRGSTHIGDFTFAAAAELASTALGDDPYGYRAEFLQLVAKAENLGVSQP